MLKVIKLLQAAIVPTLRDPFLSQVEKMLMLKENKLQQSEMRHMLRDSSRLQRQDFPTLKEIVLQKVHVPMLRGVKLLQARRVVIRRVIVLLQVILPVTSVVNLTN